MTVRWKPTQDYGIIFCDKTGENRTEEEFQNFLNDVNEAAEKHGFSRKQSGTNQALAKWYHLAYNSDGKIKING